MSGFILLTDLEGRKFPVMVDAILFVRYPAAGEFADATKAVVEFSSGTMEVKETVDEISTMLCPHRSKLAERLRAAGGVAS